MTRWPAVVLLALASFAVAEDEPTDDTPYDFAISRTWLTELRAQKTFLPTFKVNIMHRSGIKSLSEDCEVHLAGNLVGTAFGDPPAVVAEPPNVCKFRPGTTTPVTGNTSTKALWTAKLDSDVISATCDVTGFPRVYTEHAEGGTTGSSNPSHVFEMHPATRIACPGAGTLQFTKFLRAFDGLRRIKPASAQECLSTLRLWVRYHDTDGEDQYEFFQKRSGKCGNFAIAEVSSLPREWIQATGGGHTAIGRVTVNGEDQLTLKMYAIEGTAADAWFARVKTGIHNLDDPRLVHGILTYDYFSIARAIGQDGGGELAKPSHWKEINFPAALVVLGPTTVVPWE